MTLILTFNFNISQLWERSVTKLCCIRLKYTAISKICGTMARLAPANLYVLVRVTHNCFLRHSIIGGMVTKEKRLCSSRNGNSLVANSWDITSKFGQTDIHSNQKSRALHCHHNVPNESSSHQTTQWKNVSEQTDNYLQQCNDDSPLSTSTKILSDTSSQWSQWNDDWYWENGGEI